MVRWGLVSGTWKGDGRLGLSCTWLQGRTRTSASSNFLGGKKKKLELVQQSNLAADVFEVVRNPISEEKENNLGQRYFMRDFRSIKRVRYLIKHF
ncbi:hypothetical protein NPIL_336821 [Nephila pilipes]|uniref:Uncharacterized protein n=1 Tax=Nephila pilipes TaxID=299642 RepID=A0A8X6MGA8_NEPPI|nr:hypothetical protein NPIL_336821 [Nephila pilipes]